MSVDPESLQIFIYPHPSLRTKGQPVDPADDNVHAVARRMLQLMHEADGVGLAAPQVGLAWRLFVTNGRDFDPEDRVFLTRIWQHENDHLDGILIIDKMSPMDRLATRKALKELKTAATAVATGRDVL
jgi:peptide deformylase